MISEIHNYCDRWCKVCNSKDQCNFYISSKHGNKQGVLDQVQANLNQTKKILESIHMYTGKNLTHRAQVSGSSFNLFEKKRLLTIASSYKDKVYGIVKKIEKSSIDLRLKSAFSSNHISTESKQSQFREWNFHFERIQMYSQTIIEKLDQAFLEQKIEKVLLEGSPATIYLAAAKIASLCTSKSIVSWEFLINDSIFELDDCLAPLADLQKIQRETEQLFPKLNGYILPKFEKKR